MELWSSSLQRGLLHQLFGDGGKSRRHKKIPASCALSYIKDLMIFHTFLHFRPPAGASYKAGGWGGHRKLRSPSTFEMLEAAVPRELQVASCRRPLDATLRCPTGNCREYFSSFFLLWPFGSVQCRCYFDSSYSQSLCPHPSSAFWRGGVSPEVRARVRGTCFLVSVSKLSHPWSIWWDPCDGSIWWDLYGGSIWWDPYGGILCTTILDRFCLQINAVTNIKLQDGHDRTWSRGQLLNAERRGPLDIREEKRQIASSKTRVWG